MFRCYYTIYTAIIYGPDNFKRKNESMPTRFMPFQPFKMQVKKILFRASIHMYTFKCVMHSLKISNGVV